MENRIIATVTKTYEIHKYGIYTGRKVSFTVGSSKVEYLYKRVCEAENNLHNDYPEGKAYSLKKVDEKIDFIVSDEAA